MSEASDTLAEDVKGAMRVKTGTITITYRVIMFLMLGGLMLFSDRHNDARYVQLTDYKRDRDTDKELRDTVQKAADERNQEVKRQLEEIASDVKTLLRESRKP